MYNYRQRPGGGWFDRQLHARHAMGLSAPGNPSDGQARGAPARGGDEIREWESRARAHLVGPGFTARASGTAGSGEPAGRRYRAGQKAGSRHRRKQSSNNGLQNRIVAPSS